MSQPSVLPTFCVLFICLGNICRSAAADAVMHSLVDKAGLGHRILIDSAGIGGWHAGQLPDSRIRRHGALRGYAVDHRARQFQGATDMERFDFVLVMDRENFQDTVEQCETEEQRQKVLYLTRFLRHHPGRPVIPDPYYGGDAGFEDVLDLLEDACEGLLDFLKGKMD